MFLGFSRSLTRHDLPSGVGSPKSGTLGWWCCLVVAGLGHANLAGQSAQLPERLPKETVFVLGCDLRQLLGSPVGRMFRMDIAQSIDSTELPWLDMLRRLNVSLLEDVDRLTWAMTNLETNLGWMRLEGRFTPSNIRQSAARAAGERPEKIRLLGDDRIWRVEYRSTPALFLEVIDDRTLVISSGKELLRHGNRIDKPRPELLRWTANVDRHATVWFVALPDAMIAVPTDTEQERDLFEKVEGAWALLFVDSGIRLELVLRMADQTIAAKFRQALNDRLRKLPLGGDLGFQPEANRLWVLDCLKDLHVTNRELEVRLSGDWSAQTIKARLRPRSP